MTEYIFGQDGQVVEDYIINEFKLNFKEKEFIYEEDNLIYDFVGFVYKNDKILVVFPKHYMDNLKEINNEDIELLFKVIKQYNMDLNSAIAEKYYGYKNNYKSDYPFEAFYEIYDYYIRYGLYKNNVIRDKANCNNRISWKTTMRKSNIIVSDENLLYLPLYSKSEEEKHTFIGECMTFIINHTIELFPFIGSLKRVNEMSHTIDLINNRESVLRELYVYRSKVFKDSEIKLIDAIIQYLQEIKNISNGGAIHIKIKYFEHIWERMINKYLNEYFEGIEVKDIKNIKDVEDVNLVFNNKEKTNKFKFIKDHKLIDARFNDKNILEPDFYFENEKEMYVFDAKYYNNLDSIEYKQVAYTLLYGNRKTKGEKEIYSALFLPGTKTNKFNVLLDEEFKQQKDGCNFIIEQYLDVKAIMKNYINMK